MVRHGCTLFYKIVKLFPSIYVAGQTYLSYWLCCWGWCKLVHFVPMFIVDWLCRTLLKIVLFIDNFTLFPWSLFGLAAQFWVLGLGSTNLHTHTHCYKQLLFRTMWSQDRDVVLVGRTIDPGWWEIWDGEGWGGGMSVPCTTQKEGFQVSKGGISKGNWRKGLSRGCALT